jgi:exodeoxyribonuclease VII small subunit
MRRNASRRNKFTESSARIDLFMPDEAQRPNKSIGNKEETGKETPLAFEAGLQQLETIVKEMESGELPLERALELFERGMKLSDSCRKQLAEAETRVEILMKRAGDMQPEPFGNAK